MVRHPIARRTRRLPLALCLCAAVSVALPAAAQAFGYGERTLRPGLRGKDVSVLQGYLDTSGYRLGVSGRFDGDTADAVRRYEADQGMRVDGVVTRGEAERIRRFATAPPAYGGLAPITPGPVDADNVPTVAGERAKLLSDGTAQAPRSAPDAVKRVIAAGNQIARLPYRYGGGHANPVDTGYDCSGSVSFALRGGGLFRGSAPSTGFFAYGAPGSGRWITVYTNSGHMFMVVAGLRFDTSGRAQTGSRWQTEMRPAQGYTLRHPPGL